MDDRRFDAIARSLGTARSRRGALGLLAGAAGLALADADAKRRKGKGKHGKGTPARPATLGAVCTAAGSKSCAVAQAKPGAVLKDCDYAATDLAGAALNAANLSKASFADADLHGANLAGAGLGGACLNGADLSGASLRGTNLSGADLTGADLCGADLRGSNVKPAQLATATLCCSTTRPNGRKVGCPAEQTCHGGVCVHDCPVCQTYSGGACGPDPALDHACTGPCPSGQWCDAGACAGIAGTVRVTDIGSRCSHDGTPQSATACGVAVTAPDCSLCPGQAGCQSNLITDGPAGTSWYCSQSGYPECTTSADCPAERPWCGQRTPDFKNCTKICPY